mgnify:CR=1 FL=1
MRALEDPGVQAAAEAEREEALDILGDFVIYPTLFLETDDGERHVLARGYADYPVVAAKLASVSVEEPTARRHAPPTRAASTGIAIFQHEGERPGGAFSKQFLPRTHPTGTSIRGEAAQQEFVPVKGKTSYPMRKPFPRCSSKSKTRPDNMSERVLFCLPERPTRGFDNIESLEEEPGRDAAVDVRKARRRTQRSQSLWGRHHFPPNKESTSDYDCRTAHDRPARPWAV